MRMFNLLTLLILAKPIKSEHKENKFNLNFQQNDYHLEFQRVELVRFNKDYVKDMTIKTFKYNRTTPLANATFTFKVDMGNEIEVILQAYKFMSNEYRFFPIHFGANFCKMLAANVGGCGRLMKCGNFTGCPFLKDKTYHTCNFHPDESKLPPFVPSGDYKVEAQALHFSTEIFVWSAYGSITRPIVGN